MDETLFNDGNKQNDNAANAGDGPKHIAWLTFIDLLGEKLRTIVETHSGGGMYRVPNDRFCLGLPEESVLGRHQRRFGSPGSDQTTCYSASGDQALTHMPSGCRYIAFDTCKTAANRLAAVARMRCRAEV